MNKRRSTDMTKSPYCLLILLIAFSVMAMPKITVKHQRTAKGFAQVQVT